ncbi:glutathione S-transferase [Afipia sp. P52-10]|uniref:glutathione S-transferase family protein n=1 Tax=Afipia sp. P52-10 TaxID=1429916 RepID=UPI0003DF1629|nr:glutathione S-transferase family protein [Afipia sp. P52-10]ETR77098.1 glutathione S-transferase [Afipia sp. P52-10]
MKLYYDVTMNPRKVCALAKHVGAPLAYVHIRLGKGEHQTPDFLALNPNGKVPVLQDGDTTLWEANAIMAYLARAASSDLWPDDGGKQVEVLRWLSWDAEHFSRHTGDLYFEYIIKPQFALGDLNTAAVTQATAAFRQYGRVLNDHLRGRRYLLGDALTIADFAVAVTLPYAERAKIPVDEFPEIVRWHDRLNALAAWRDPFPAAAA